MRSIHLMTHVYSNQSLSENIFKDFSRIESDSPKKKTKRAEEEALATFVKCFSSQNYELFNNFYYGYTIAQISKEFDLLRIGEDDVVNIEIKSKATTEKMRKQLIQNEYYLSPLERKLHLYSFNADAKKLYQLQNGELVESDFSDLERVLANQKIDEMLDIDELFLPSRYLVSPFNHPAAFLEGKYFLTEQQENIKKDILKSMNDHQYCFFAVEGRPGTGKTLLVYDIIKSLMHDTEKKGCIIHCGMTNEGQKVLSHNEFDIIQIKELGHTELLKYDLVIVDEAQRIREQQFEIIVDTVKENHQVCVFSFDPGQTLSDTESQRDIPDKIAQLDGLNQTYALTQRIRTNKELASFIKNLFDLGKTNKDQINHLHINVAHYQGYEEAESLIGYLTTKKNWSFINYTPSKINETPFKFLQKYETGNSHSVIGQEYDKVAVIIDDIFFYTSKNKLAAKRWQGTVYNPVKMLYQAMTRARNELYIIIINNEEILKNCIQILKSK